MDCAARAAKVIDTPVLRSFGWFWLLAKWVSSGCVKPIWSIVNLTGSICDPHDLSLKYNAISADQFYGDLVAEAYTGDAVQLFYGWAAEAMDLAERERIAASKLNKPAVSSHDSDTVGHDSLRAELWDDFLIDIELISKCCSARILFWECDHFKPTHNPT